MPVAPSSLRQRGPSRKPLVKAGGAMKKTSARGAYAPARKKQMSIRRNPIVETKSDLRNLWYVPEDPADETTSLWPSHLNWQYLGIGNDISTDALVVIPSVNQIFPVDVYNQKQIMKHSTDSNQDGYMLGNQIFAKSLYLKVQIRLPQNNGLIDFPQCQMYLVHGWVKHPLRLTGLTTPTASGVTTGGTNDIIEAHIVKQVKEHFDKDADELEWRPKSTSATSVQIEGYKKLHFNATDSILPKPDQGSIIDESTFDPVTNKTEYEYAHPDLGFIPDKKFSLTWKLNRKLTYELGMDTPAPDPANPTARYNKSNQRPWYINGHYYPFWMIYMPGGERLKYKEDEENRIQIRYNERLDFTDS